jgi:CBS domain-containing protein
MFIEQVLKAKSAPATIVDPDATAGVTAGLLGERKKGLALVCGPDNKLLGVVSAMDLLRALGEHGEAAAALPARQVMNAEVTVCSPRDTVEDALKLMAQERIRHLPVIEDDKLKGLISIRDLLESRFEQAEVEVHELRKYIFGLGPG